jgi:hypothetical protein
LILRDVELFDLALGAAGYNQGEVFFAALTVAAWLAADLFSESGRGPEELLPSHHRFEFRAAYPFGLSHSRRTHRRLLIVIYYV